MVNNTGGVSSSGGVDPKVVANEKVEKKGKMRGSSIDKNPDNPSVSKTISVSSRVLKNAKSPKKSSREFRKVREIIRDYKAGTKIVFKDGQLKLIKASKGGSGAVGKSAATKEGARKVISVLKERVSSGKSVEGQIRQLDENPHFQRVLARNEDITESMEELKLAQAMSDVNLEGELEKYPGSSLQSAISNRSAFFQRGCRNNLREKDIGDNETNHQLSHKLFSLAIHKSIENGTLGGMRAEELNRILEGVDAIYELNKTLGVRENYDKLTEQERNEYEEKIDEFKERFDSLYETYKTVSNMGIELKISVTLLKTTFDIFKNTIHNPRN